MEKENEIKFTVYSEKEDYDKIFTEIRNIPKDSTPDKIVKEIQAKLSLTLLLTTVLDKPTIDNFPIYRVRVVSKDQNINEELESSFSYPPNAEDIPMGRANLKNEQVFYASGDQHTPFHEKANAITLNSSIVYLSKWGIKDQQHPVYMRNLFLGINSKEENYSSIMASGVNEQFEKIFTQMPDKVRENFTYAQKQYTDLFTSKGKEEGEYYHITSAIANNTFTTENIDIPLISYPSVAKDKKAINFAFRKNFADRNVYLKEVDKVIVTKLTEDEVQFTPISRGIVDDGKVKWLKPRIRVEKVHYESAFVSYDGIRDNFTRLNSGDKLTKCCKEHSFTVKEFLYNENINESTFLKGIKDIPQKTFDYKLTDKSEYFLILETFGNIFVTNNIKESAKVKFIGLPIIYSMDYI